MFVIFIWSFVHICLDMAFVIFIYCLPPFCNFRLILFIVFIVFYIHRLFIYFSSKNLGESFHYVLK